MFLKVSKIIDKHIDEELERYIVNLESISVQKSYEEIM